MSLFYIVINIIDSLIDFYCFHRVFDLEIEPTVS